MLSKTLLLIAFASSLSAAVADRVDVYVCDHGNSPLKRQFLSHGQLARICIQTTESGVTLGGIDSFHFFQGESGIDQVVVKDCDVDETETTEVNCTENLCVLETYLSGDYFVSGGLTVVATGLVKATNSGIRLRGSKQSSDIILSEIELSLNVKTHPLPSMIHA